jgi:uncharacterized protein YraI
MAPDPSILAYEYYCAHCFPWAWKLEDYKRMKACQTYWKSPFSYHGETHIHAIERIMQHWYSGRIIWESRKEYSSGVACVIHIQSSNANDDYYYNQSSFFLPVN